MRIHKTGNFTVMSNYHFKERGMSLKAKGLLSLMLSLPDDWNYSVSGLVTLSKDGKDSVMRALSELEEFGFLTRVRMTNDKGQFTGIEYNIYEEPQRALAVAEKPILEEQREEKQNTEKPPLLNTNSINDLFNQLYNELSTNDYELLELYKSYIMMREDIKAPLTKTGLQKLIERSKRLSKNNVRIEKLLLETALINNWKNVYLPREDELEAVNDEVVDELKNLFGLE